MLGPVFAMSGPQEPFSYCRYFINSFCFIFVYSVAGGACTSVCRCVHPHTHVQRPELGIKRLSPCCFETEAFTEANPPCFCQAAWSARSSDPPSSGPVLGLQAVSTSHVGFVDSGALCLQNKCSDLQSHFPSPDKCFKSLVFY